jgi:hypothetical protein
MTKAEAASALYEAGRDFLVWLEYLDAAEIEELLKYARRAKALGTLIRHRKRRESMEQSILSRLFGQSSPLARLP